MSKGHQLTFVTPLKQDKGIFKPVFRQPYPSLPIRITLPKDSADTLPPEPCRVVVDRVLAKVQYGGGCMGDQDLFNAIGLSTLVDNDGFREIRSSHLSAWIVVGEEDSLRARAILNKRGSALAAAPAQEDRRGFMIKCRTAKTGIVEIRNVVFKVVARYQIAIELRFDNGQPIGRTPWQPVDVQVRMQGVKKSAMS